MVNIEIIGTLLILFFVGIAIYYDLKTYRIPNRLNLAGAFCGILYSLLVGGAGGVLSVIAGIAIPVVSLFALFGVGVLGAGDIKLLAAIGAFLGVLIVKVIIGAMMLVAIWGTFTVILRLLTGRRLTLTRLHMSLPIGVSAVVVSCLIV